MNTVDPQRLPATMLADQEYAFEFLVQLQERYQEAVDVLTSSQESGPLRYRMDTADGLVRFKIFTFAELDLHKVIPHLTSLGAEVIAEQPFEWRHDAKTLRSYDFGLQVPPQWGDSAVAEQRFIAAFDASYSGRCEADQFNRLVTQAGLNWKEIVWLRAIGRFLKQARVGFSQDYLAAALYGNPTLAVGLARAFTAKFDAGSALDAQAILDEVMAGIDQVTSLDQDRILRMYVSFIRACTRTNAFIGAEALAFKIASRELPFLPEPRPLAEIFVYSPRVLGVHLRFGAVARGGLRWSDRMEDFRTEVLGLAKAQTVKNTVIVPVGAKGGFVPQHLPPASDRAAWLEEGIACYQSFVTALLSVTDNIVDGKVVAPASVVRHDGDDPYLVVAADKGTATFSDIANEISTRSGYWLGDAFASGGSTGFDHKRMGITAKGAWESVKRHFAERGIDPGQTDFTCVGIGDMSGDVFGNGMLLSSHIKLIAAFDHRNIFIDPNPDPLRSFAERERLFALPRSSWADYDKSLLSEGGGIFSRTAKSVLLSAQAKRALGWSGPARLTPNDLISVILRAEVDLLWNGGVGTYFKAAAESNEDVGDRANDSVRVNGAEVRARCAVEGGNLGWTQLGRVEYARNHGAVNTDFIDNSAGVDTSDHEVNIKILLDAAITSGALDEADRDPLLAQLQDDIAVSVLRHNVAQNLALSNAAARAGDMAGEHAGWLKMLESARLLDRKLEQLPSGTQITQRLEVGEGLTRPELAVLLAFTKIALKKWMLASELPDDPYLADRLTEYFPKALRDRFASLIPQHRLGREIITTVAVNRFVDSQGMTAYYLLHTQTGAGLADIVRAQLAARSIYAVGRSEVLLGRMSDLNAAVATELRLELRRMVERATRWLLHNRRSPLDIKAAVAEFSEPVAAIRAELGELLTPSQAARAESKRAYWVSQGAPDELAAEFSVFGYAHFALGIAQTAGRLGVDAVAAARVHTQLCAELSLDAMDAQVYFLPRKQRWDAMARAALRDELLAAQSELTAQAIGETGVERLDEPAELVQDWIAMNPGLAERAAMLREISSGDTNLARMSVGLGQIRAILRAE
ncbi:MAG: NAD-glutamate dehydrogenase [Propionibacteriaceae bacterium]|jgi:glutamate dehydrogenase|nr:NAD-glutamate dehydrogenase [Propionibacteriaceae bacterium]